MPTLQFPDDIRRLLSRRYRNKQQEWLVGEGKWPLEISLGLPGESTAVSGRDAVFEWVQAWQNWHGHGQLQWRERRWRALGTQRIPERLVLSGPIEIAAWLDEHANWGLASQRYEHLTTRWPALVPQLSRHFDALTGYSDADFERLERMLAWLKENPQSNLYPRQMPVPGIDSKWLELKKGLIAELMAALDDIPQESGNFYARYGLRQPPSLIRMRVLDHELRLRLGGLGDVTAPVDDLAAMDLSVATVYVVENLQTGLAFHDLSNSIVIMGLGYNVDLLARLPWALTSCCTYWGDIDTHGFAILNRARSYLPHLTSALMDEPTLLRHKNLWVDEQQQHGARELPLLTEDEQTLYRGLKENRWGINVRLEQERVAWDYAWRVLEML